MKPFSLYIHIPYCFQKCPYCDFNTYAVSAIPEQDYVSAVLSELDYRATTPDWNGRTVRSIYFGGGTPSLFSSASIWRIISIISRLFPVDEQAEITLEANPGTVDSDSLGGYREAGVNRLSLGSQSFQLETLRMLGRIHTPAQTEAAVETARNVGFRNISLDLMFGVPEQTLEEVRRDLRVLVTIDPTHISPYGLTIEKGTPFYQAYKKGKLSLPAEEVVLSMMNEIENVLGSHGYGRYEISNYAKPGKEARHNMSYWDGLDYLGLGAGAHSFVASWEGARETGGSRWANYALPGRYIKEAVAHGHTQAWSDTLSRRDRIFEYFFLGLRKTEGVSLAEFESRYGCKVDEAYPALLTVLTEHELVSLENDRLALTSRGLKLSDSVIENFVAPEMPRRRPAAEARAPLKVVGKKHNDLPLAANE